MNQLVQGVRVGLHSFKRMTNMPSKSILLFVVGRSIWWTNWCANSTDGLFIHQHTVPSSHPNQCVPAYLVLTSHSLGALWFLAISFLLTQHSNLSLTSTWMSASQDPSLNPSSQSIHAWLSKGTPVLQESQSMSTQWRDKASHLCQVWAWVDEHSELGPALLHQAKPCPTGLLARKADRGAGFPGLHFLRPPHTDSILGVPGSVQSPH